MEKNVGGADRWLRFVAGAVLIGAGMMAPVGTGAKAVMFVFAGAMLLTGLFSW